MRVVPTLFEDAPTGDYRDLGRFELEIDVPYRGYGLSDEEQTRIISAHVDFAVWTEAKTRDANAIYSCWHIVDGDRIYIRGHAVHLFAKRRAQVYTPGLIDLAKDVEGMRDRWQQFWDQREMKQLSDILGVAPKLPSSSFPRRRPI